MILALNEVQTDSLMIRTQQAESTAYNNDR